MNIIKINLWNQGTYIIKEIEKLVLCIYGDNARPGMLEEYEKSL
jgi:hypothetical protein